MPVAGHRKAGSAVNDVRATGIAVTGSFGKTSTVNFLVGSPHLDQAEQEFCFSIARDEMPRNLREKTVSRRFVLQEGGCQFGSHGSATAGLTTSHR